MTMDGRTRPAERPPDPVAAPATPEDRFLSQLPGVTPRRAELLQALGLRTVGDLVRHLPRRYEDRRNLVPISAATPGELQALHGEIASVRSRVLRRGQTIIEAILVDPGAGPLSPRLQLVWFNQAYLLEWLRPGVRVHVFGQVRLRSEKLQIAAPEFEIDSTAEEEASESSPHVRRIVPIYPLTRGLPQRFLRTLTFRVLEGLAPVEGPHDYFHPEGPSSAEAFRRLHFPESFADLERARSRLIFEEHFAFASQLAFRRRECRRPGGVAFRWTAELDRKIRSIFPFELSPDQDTVVAELARDLASPIPMYRLLQGDVGTGKTAVALYAMLVAVRNRCQAVLMAPTEVLAEQHHATIRKYLAQHPVKVELLTGSVKGARRKEVLAGALDGSAHILVGTQALIQKGVEYHRLGLAVIDEQHRFGVVERLKIRKKGDHPHILVMTATPIPRSLCLTCYGDLDLSLLRTRPRGAAGVKTFLVPARKRASAMEFVRKELRAGRQAYFIYPLIEESEALALPAAVKARERLAKEVFQGFEVGLVHGGLASEEKEAALEQFRRGNTHVLVATVVVEVGIDVPNASVIVLEDASRFGLSQLHQLRGRVGRGRHQGYCLVGYDGGGREAEARLKVFASTSDGFRIAEEDLKLRGPGDFLGVRQSGRPHFLLGNPIQDLQGFLRVKELADRFWSSPENEAYRARWATQLNAGLGDDGFLGLD